MKKSLLEVNIDFLCDFHANLARFWRHFGRPGRVWRHLGPSWRHLGAILGPSRRHLCPRRLYKAGILAFGLLFLRCYLCSRAAPSQNLTWFSVSQVMLKVRPVATTSVGTVGDRLTLIWQFLFCLVDRGLYKIPRSFGGF